MGLFVPATLGLCTKHSMGQNGFVSATRPHALQAAFFQAIVFYRYFFLPTFSANHPWPDFRGKGDRPRLYQQSYPQKFWVSSTSAFKSTV
jgi:hypothetical protein